MLVVQAAPWTDAVLVLNSYWNFECIITCKVCVYIYDGMCACIMMVCPSTHVHVVSAVHTSHIPVV